MKLLRKIVDILFDSGILLLLTLTQFRVSIFQLDGFGSQKKRKKSCFVHPSQQILPFSFLILKVFEQFVIGNEFISIFLENYLALLNLLVSVYAFSHTASLPDNPT